MNKIKEFSEKTCNDSLETKESILEWLGELQRSLYDTSDFQFRGVEWGFLINSLPERVKTIFGKIMGKIRWKTSGTLSIQFGHGENPRDDVIKLIDNIILEIDKSNFTLESIEQLFQEFNKNWYLHQLDILYNNTQTCIGNDFPDLKPLTQQISYVIQELSETDEAKEYLKNGNIIAVDVNEIIQKVSAEGRIDSHIEITNELLVLINSIFQQKMLEASRNYLSYEEVLQMIQNHPNSQDFGSPNIFTPWKEDLFEKINEFFYREKLEKNEVNIGDLILTALQIKLRVFRNSLPFA